MDRKTMTIEPIICYLKPLSDEEINAINKYWTLKDDCNEEYKYTMKEIDSQHGTECKKVSSLIKKTTCMAQTPSFICSDCKQAIPARNRSEFVRRLSSSSFQCQGCEKKQLDSLREESIKILQNFLDSQLNKLDYYSKLSYIDKLVLSAILSNEYQERKPIFKHDTRMYVSGSENVDNSTLSRLAGLGALVKIHELPEEIQLAEMRVYGRSSGQFYRKTRNGYRPQQNPLAIEKGIYFSLPAGFSNSSEFFAKIYDDITNGGITTEEIAELKQLVVDIRVENFYRLIEHISQEFKLEISNSVPLSALLFHLSENYALTNCCYTFYFFVEKVIVYIYKNNPDSYSRPHLFTKFVSNYIQEVQDNGWELKLTRQLPETIFTSNLEALVSRSFIDGHFNWHSLTANEVIEHWLSKVSIRDCPNPPLLA